MNSINSIISLFGTNYTPIFESSESSISYELYISEIVRPENTLNYDNTFHIFIFIFVIMIIVYFIVIFWNKLYKKQENMTGGTMTQLMAQDSQDVYLKGNVDKLATGNYNLFWNQGTREANVFQNRGQPLYSILLPDTSMNPTNNILEVSNNYVNNIIDNEVNRKENKLTFSNPVLTLNDIEPKQNETDKFESKYLILPKSPNPSKSNSSKSNLKPNQKPNLKFNSKQLPVPILSPNALPSSLTIDKVANSNPYELAFVGKQVTMNKETADNLPALTKWSPEDKLFQLYTDRNLNQKNCLKDPASCTGFAGGMRLDDFVQSTKAVPSVNLDNNYFFPDSYLGSYRIDPLFDINKPYPFIPDANRV